MSIKKIDEENSYKTKKEAEELVTLVLSDLKYQVETNKGVLPQAILFTEYDPGTRTKDGTFQKKMTINHIDLSHTFDTPEAKDKASATLRRAALECGGYCAIVAAEGWMVEGCKEKPLGSLAHHPKRKEVVLVTIEHKKLGARFYTADVIKKGDEEKTLGEFKLHDNDMIRGRFNSILPCAAN